ncbi:MAG TPA: Hpt domain-containing protein [Gammaproteobacteria bacterium]|jgi:HPt (histidine-containing phosphotransfer) domain-containing protein|nr:Hpt domain-containing protein [Gammaproteobacteria bacterium]
MTDETPDSLRAVLAALQPEIRQMLAEDLPVDLQRCRDGFAAARWGELREYVHRIKGTASFCRLEGLKGVCVRIEENLAADIPPPATDMEELTREVARVVGALES